MPAWRSSRRQRGCAGYGIADGRQGLEALLELPHPPSAVFVTGSELALGVLGGARRLGPFAQRDLAVVGYTDCDAALLVDAPLTTVAVPARAAGERAMGVMRRLDRHDRPSRGAPSAGIMCTAGERPCACRCRSDRPVSTDWSCRTARTRALEQDP
jgi:DNA-binding LacI/PurR family transcriptional regulator